jgi:peptide/nickel transport system substrate-binding protein
MRQEALSSLGQGSHLSRRRLVGLGTLGVAAAIAAACGGDNDSGRSAGVIQPSAGPQAAGEGTPKRGGRAVAVVNSSQRYLSVDPVANGDQIAHVGNASILMNEHLLTFDYNEPSKIAFRLAESIEQPDPTTYVVHLRGGVKFSNDDALTAESVKLGIARHDRKIPGSPFATLSAIPVFPRVESIDPTTVRLRTDKPYPDMYQDLWGPLGIPVSPKYYATAEDPLGFAEAKQLRPVTAAPFKVTNFRPRETIEAERFDGYWGGPKYLDRINNPAIAEDATRVTLLKTGEAHLIGLVPPQDVEDVQKDKSINLDSRTGVKIQFLFYNLLRAPFGPPSPKTRAFRRAIVMATDRDAIVKNIWLGQGKVGDSILMPWQFGYKAQPLIPYDPKGARQLLEQNDWDFSYTCRFLGTQGAFTADKAFIEATVDMIRQVGVKVDLQILSDYSTFVQTVSSTSPDIQAKFDMFITSLTQWPEPTSGLPNRLDGNNILRYDDPQLRALIEQALYDVNNESRAKTIAEVQRIAVDACAHAPMGFQNYAIAWRKELKGVKLTGLEGWDLRDAWLDKA